MSFNLSSWHLTDHSSLARSPACVTPTPAYSLHPQKFQPLTSGRKFLLSLDISLRGSQFKSSEMFLELAVEFAFYFQIADMYLAALSNLQRIIQSLRRRRQCCIERPSPLPFPLSSLPSSVPGPARSPNVTATATGIALIGHLFSNRDGSRWKYGPPSQ